MVIRIDPRLPAVWRTTSELQLGVARPLALLAEADHVDLLLIEALRVGTTRSALDVLAEEMGADDRRVDVLLATLEPALLAEPARALNGTVALSGTSPATRRLAEAIGELGHTAVAIADADPDRIDLAVLVGDYVIAPARSAPWLHRDTPHLAVVFDDAGARVGPLVEPGEGPCLHCLEIERTRTDAAWPAIAGQLLARTADASTPRTVPAAVAEAAAAIDGRLRRGERPLASAAVRIDLTSGARTLLALRASERCGCRTLPGIVTALGERAGARPALPSSAAAGAVPA